MLISFTFLVILKRALGPLRWNSRIEKSLSSRQEVSIALMEALLQKEHHDVADLEKDEVDYSLLH